MKHALNLLPKICNRLQIMKHYFNFCWWRINTCMMGHIAGLVKPSRCKPVFISGQLMKSLHNSPLR